MYKNLLLAAALCLSVGTAKAITFELGQALKDDTIPNGPAPWLSATFEAVEANTVKLTLTSSLPSSAEFFSDFYFNSSVALATPTFVAGSQVGAYDLPSFATSAGNGNPTKAPDNAGTFGYAFAFTTSNSQQGSKRYNLQDSGMWLFSAAGLTAESFNVVSANNQGNTQWHVAAHVQGIPTGAGSVVIVDKPGGNVPEPVSLALTGGLIGGLAFLRRRK